MLATWNANNTEHVGRSARISFGHAANAGERPNLLEIRLQTEPAATPNAQGFALATNGNGTAVSFTGVVQLRTAEGQDTYRVELHDAKLRSWSIVVGADVNQPVIECWDVVSTRFTVTADGQPVPVESQLLERLNLS